MGKIITRKDIEQAYPGLFRVPQDPMDIEYYFSDSSIYSQPLIKRNMSYNYGVCDIVFYPKNGRRTAHLTLCVDEECQPKGGLLTLLGIMSSLNGKTCIDLYLMEIDIRVETQFGQYEYFDRQRIMRQYTLNNIIQPEP